MTKNSRYTPFLNFGAFTIFESFIYHKCKLKSIRMNETWNGHAQPGAARVAGPWQDPTMFKSALIPWSDHCCWHSLKIQRIGTCKMLGWNSLYWKKITQPMLPRWERRAASPPLLLSWRIDVWHFHCWFFKRHTPARVRSFNCSMKSKQPGSHSVSTSALPSAKPLAVAEVGVCSGQAGARRTLMELEENMMCCDMKELRYPSSSEGWGSDVLRTVLWATALLMQTGTRLSVTEGEVCTCSPQNHWRWEKDLTPGCCSLRASPVSIQHSTWSAPKTPFSLGSWQQTSLLNFSNKHRLFFFYLENLWETVPNSCCNFIGIFSPGVTNLCVCSIISSGQKAMAAGGIRTDELSLLDWTLRNKGQGKDIISKR